MYVAGVDRAGCPSCTWRPALAPAPGGGAAAAARRVRGLVRMVERARAVNPGAEGLTVLCDCTGLSCGHYDHRAALAALAVFRVPRPAPPPGPAGRPAGRRCAPLQALTRAGGGGRGRGRVARAGAQEQYPGVVGAGLVFPASWAVSAVLAVARAALRPEERGLLHPLRDDELPAALAARFDPSQAPFIRLRSTSPAQPLYA
jgi:hypothetical protein